MQKVLRENYNISNEKLLKECKAFKQNLIETAKQNEEQFLYELSHPPDDF